MGAKLRSHPAWILFLIFGLIPACGSGGGGGGGGGGGTTPATGGVQANPDVALIFVSGHEGLFDANPSRSYLDDALGPALSADILGAGYTVAVGYFVDHYTQTDYPGYEGLLNQLIAIRDFWINGRSSPTRIVLIAHSHGGVWANAAIRQLPSVPITLQVALDHSSYGWGIVGHDAANGLIGGDPRDDYSIGVIGDCAGASGISSESGTGYDLEDVVFPNVARALEVRSGASPLGGELYDERWNVRVDGSFTGMSCYHSDTTHTEVRQTSGPTYSVVRNWILERLTGF